MNGEWVGTWTVKEHGPAQFEYAASWLTSPHARVLSLSLPFLPGNRPHEGLTVANYFDNLLPDNKPMRERLQRKFSTGSTGAFGLLSEIGRDCVGAVQLLPEDEEPHGWNHITSEPLTDEDVESVLKSTLSSDLAGDAAGDFRISLAGAQEKTALLYHEGKWHKPLGATPTTHIFKLPLGLVGGMQADFRASVENEWLCSKIVESFGLEIAHCDMSAFGETKALIVQRFDRKMSANRTYWLRLPQEDMCQATGMPSSLKYEADGGPGIEMILDILRGSGRHDHDRRSFFKTQIVFWLLAAPDGHAKNFSIFHEHAGTYRATPLYDVLSAWPIIGPGKAQLPWQKAKLAMAIRANNAHYAFAKVQRRHFNVMAAKCGVGKDAEDLIQEILDQVPAVIENVSARLPQDFPEDVSTSILNGLSDSAAKLKKMPSN